MSDLTEQVRTAFQPSSEATARAAGWLSNTIFPEAKRESIARLMLQDAYTVEAPRIAAAISAGILESVEASVAALGLRGSLPPVGEPKDFYVRPIQGDEPTKTVQWSDDERIRWGTRYELSDTQSLVAAMVALPSDKVRLDVMRAFCRHCGGLDPECVCWNDE